jgi:ABC-type uncharacterized transport system YnjBCD ATPase subunit
MKKATCKFEFKIFIFRQRTAIQITAIQITFDDADNDDGISLITVRMGRNDNESHKNQQS